jgi:hypothetical protein
VGKAIEVPGLAALNTGGDGEVNAVSCVRAGTCTAAGDYTDRHHHLEGFVTSHTG